MGAAQPAGGGHAGAVQPGPAPGPQEPLRFLTGRCPCGQEGGTCAGLLHGAQAAQLPTRTGATGDGGWVWAAARCPRTRPGPGREGAGPQAWPEVRTRVSVKASNPQRGEDRSQGRAQVLRPWPSWRGSCLRPGGRGVPGLAPEGAPPTQHPPRTLGPQNPLPARGEVPLYPRAEGWAGNPHPPEPRPARPGPPRLTTPRRGRAPPPRGPPRSRGSSRDRPRRARSCPRRLGRCRRGRCSRPRARRPRRR